MIAQAYVDGLFRYEPEAGALRWRVRPLAHFPDQRACDSWNTRNAGKVAGAIKDGYCVVGIDGHQYRAHRIVWLLVYGEPIPKEIDHIDGDPWNNRLSNLRAATRSTNMANARRPKNNKSGVKGVWLHACGSFQAAIVFNKQHYHLGSFTTLEEAAEARRVAAERLYKEFARHG